MVHRVFVWANSPRLLFELRSFYLKTQIAIIAIDIRNQRESSWFRIRSWPFPIVVSSFIVIVSLGIHVIRSHRKCLLTPKSILVIKVILGLVQIFIICKIIKFVLVIFSMSAFLLVCFLRVWLVIKHNLIWHQWRILVIILLRRIRIILALLHKLLARLCDKVLVLVSGLADLMSVVIGCLRNDLPVLVSIIANNFPIVISCFANEFSWL